MVFDSKELIDILLEIRNVNYLYLNGGLRMKKLNCWEFKKCGREFGGEKTGELGVCPSYLAFQHTGLHGGRGAGRCCWVINGTLCGGIVQDKLKNCLDCDFYRLVGKEEGEHFIPLKQLKHYVNEK